MKRLAVAAPIGVAVGFGGGWIAKDELDSERSEPQPPPTSARDVLDRLCAMTAVGVRLRTCRPTATDSLSGPSVAGAGAHR